MPKPNIISLSAPMPDRRATPNRPAAAGVPAQLLMNFNMGLMQRGIMPGEVLVTGSSCLGLASRDRP